MDKNDNPEIVIEDEDGRRILLDADDIRFKRDKYGRITKITESFRSPENPSPTTIIRKNKPGVDESTLCNEKDLYWRLSDTRLPTKIRTILRLWLDNYGTINFARKCKRSRDRRKSPSGVMEFYLNCGFIKSSSTRYQEAKSFLHHVHLMYDYNSGKLYYSSKNYKIISYRGKVFDLLDNRTAETVTEMLAKDIQSQGPRPRPTYNDKGINAELSPRRNIDVDLKRTATSIVEEMFTSLNCSGHDLHFQNSGDYTGKRVNPVRFAESSKGKILPPPRRSLRKTPPLKSEEKDRLMNQLEQKIQENKSSDECCIS